jgi:hypothetical protein
VKKPVSKFAFQKCNLQRYIAAVHHDRRDNNELGEVEGRRIQHNEEKRNQLASIERAAVGRCTLNQVDP